MPLWGFEDEADPTVFSRKIDTAADHGLDYFLWDWYWYDDGPFLNRCLEAGYLAAPNRNRLKFALMWANHNWVDIFPIKRSQYDTPKLLYNGAITEQTFDRLTDHIVENYFSQPSYWQIDGSPYFSIYETYRFVEGIGGVKNARSALDRFRAKTRAAGFSDLHLNAIVWGVQLLPGETAISNPKQLLAALGFDSVTSYVAVHHVPTTNFPVTSYLDVSQTMSAYWEEAATAYALPYYPNVTVGWDSSPRTVQSDRFDDLGYPFTATLNDSNPTDFKAALEAAKVFLDRQPLNQRIVNINAWNEWTEGSYLEPDADYGLSYLEAVRTVFGRA